MSAADVTLSAAREPEPRGSSSSGVPLAPFAAIAGLATAVLYLLAVPIVLVAVPAATLGAVLTTRYPATAVVGIFLMTGAIGTLTAFTPVPVAETVNFVLICLWLGILGTYIFSTSSRQPWLWPGLVAPGLYIAITAIQIPLAESIDLGFASFSASAWYMTAFLLVGLAPWPAGTLNRTAKGLVVAALLVGAYCTFRFLTGESAQEYAAARAAAPNLDDRFSGSMLGANQLSAWSGTAIPFCLALAVGWRGRWRLVSFAAIATLAIVVLATDVRAGVAAAAIGVLVVLLLHQLAPAFPGRAGIGLLVVALVAAVSIGAFAVASEGTTRAERLESLLNPGEDITYSERLKRWDLALKVMAENPLGLGLGKVGGVAVTRAPLTSAEARYGTDVGRYLDNSFLKIGLEQGGAVMGLFIVGMLLLFGGLAVRALNTASSESASLAIGACGALAALMVLFYGGDYIEGMPISSSWLLVGLGVAAVTMRNVDKPGMAQNPEHD